MKKNIQLINYSEKEGDCQCGCGAELDHKLLITLQAFIFSLERLLDCKVRHIITSGSRCEAHNKKVGGAKDSQHIKKLAVDGIFQKLENGKWIQIDNEIIARHAKDSRLFGGVGYFSYKKQGKNLVHLDIRPGNMVVMW